MKRVGILLQSKECNGYFYKIVEDLSNSSEVELFFLLNSPKGKTKSFVQKLKEKGLKDLLSYIFFKLVVIVEFSLLSMIFKNIKQHKKMESIDKFIDNNILYLAPIFSKSGLFVKYPDKDIESIKSLKLDLMIRGNAKGIFRGDILYSSKEGILSFHHGDNRYNRGGPAGFWEVYQQRPSTGFIIQILSEELDGGAVVFRSDIATKRSYTENLVALYRESYPFMSKVIFEYLSNGKLPSIEEPIPYSGKILKVPTPLISLIYSIKTFNIFLTFFVKRVIFNKRDRWSVSFVKRDWNNVVLRKGIEIKNPKNHFFADPFVVSRDGRTICFVEDYSYKTKMGSISAIEIFDNNSYKVLGSVLNESFHLSYPYIFEYKDELYMVPESSKAKSIRLYKSIEFPMKWEYQKDLFQNINATDSVIFYYNNLWWILFSYSITGQNYNSQLLAYYTDNPINGKWIPHSCNPIVNDSTISRNGGVILRGNRVIRARQKQGFNIYGASLTLSEIIELSPSSFKEEEIAEINPDFFSDIKGIHHFYSNGEYTVYDYFRSARVGLITVNQKLIQSWL